MDQPFTKQADKVEKVAPEESEKPAEVTAENESIDDKRLYVMNLSYAVTKDELNDVFSKFGDIVDIEIPFRKGGHGVTLGFGFIRY